MVNDILSSYLKIVHGFPEWFQERFQKFYSQEKRHRNIVEHIQSKVIKICMHDVMIEMW